MVIETRIDTLIIDDEASACSRLRTVLAPFAQINIIGEARDGIEAVTLISRLQPKLVFLDVQMPGLDGFEVLRSLPADVRWPLIIFATAFDRYALAAFEANAVGYLLKPINRDQLRAALERAERLLGSAEQAADAHSTLHSLAQSTRQDLQQIVARARDRFLLIGLDEVYCFRVEDGVTKVKTSTSWHSTNYAIGDLETRLPDPPFFRAHRHTLVNLRLVAEIAPLFNGAYVLIMKDPQRSEIQVSERQSKAVRERLQL